eukprot:Plantae.Rhodophyta-Hildenbrandia_rubra.ctg2947.p2 GENE.Plantae.Rhodophyta-Hildenbrandia_rubra.ctg2947~~Plantae.Rhodophyta-Hildenbrandia_rubra.ctg2947.p2  ORF type:complete len:175 (-),score=49.01 Plantae.Rhodophyta-Hildenbrandia_rubra.ctg2947:780-1304(-)
MSVDRNRRSALHFAAANGLSVICERLIVNGADVDLQDVMGLTALHMAAGYRRVRTLEVLLEKGADPHIESLEGQVPFDLVEKLLDSTPRKRLFMENTVWKTTKEIYDILDRVTEDEEVDEDGEEGEEVKAGVLEGEEVDGTKFTVRRRDHKVSSGIEDPSSDVQVTVRVKTKKK